MNALLKSQDVSADLKVLLVDDDASTLEELCDVVELEGWKSVTASSVEDALDILADDEDIRIVVSDVHFVDPFGKAANGIQFVSRAQARFSDRPLSYLILSGDPNALEASVQVSAFNFLSKPFLADDLINAIRSAVICGGEEQEDPGQVYNLIKGAADKDSDMANRT